MQVVLAALIVIYITTNCSLKIFDSFQMRTTKKKLKILLKHQEKSQFCLGIRKIMELQDKEFVAIL